eukprot:SAG25_NODE_4912_length_732_cov_1.194313_1_plen_111_part_01
MVTAVARRADLRPQRPLALLLAVVAAVRSSGAEVAAACTPAGTERWSFTTGGMDDSSGYSSPAVGPDRAVYVGSGDHKLYAVTAEGHLKWNLTTGRKVDSSPALGPDGTVY